MSVRRTPATRTLATRPLATRSLAVLLVAAAAGTLTALFPGAVLGALLTAMAVALGLLLAGAVLVALLTRLVRRSARQALREHPHLRRLGRPFEHRFSGARVAAVEVGDQVALQLVWQDRQTVLLDAAGVPDAMTSDGPGEASWVLPPRPLDPVEQALLRDLAGTEVTLSESGLVGLPGPQVLRRRLQAANGLDLRVDSGLPVG